MKQTSRFYLIVLAAFSLIISACNDPSPATPGYETEIDEQALDLKLGIELQAIFHQHPESNGMLLCVESKDNNLNSMVAVGKSEKGGNSMSPNQVILIASNTKTYVSAAILRLTELKGLNIDASIEKYISAKSAAILSKRGYNLKEISIAHLLSHTSGIRDYAGDEQYMQMIKADPTHRWSRDEQIQLATQFGDPHGQPGWGFAYADVNYLLATEIIEQQTGLPFYTAMRELLKYDELGLHKTWFYTLEAVPSGAEALAHQYWTSEGIDNHKVDPSFDLFGGGGIAATARDMTTFTQALFTGKVFDHRETLELMKRKMPMDQGENPHYYLGLSESTIAKHTAIGHGGFWVTSSMYFPELETSIGVAIMDRDAKALRKNVFEMTVKNIVETKNK